MMRANTKVAIKQADIIINVPLAEFGSLDWRRSTELIAEGYKAAEAMRDQLLPLAVSDGGVRAWQAGRAAPPAHRAADADVRARRGLQLERRAAAHATCWRATSAWPFDVEPSRPTSRCSPASIATRPITWRIRHNAAGENGLLVQARPKPYGPPFMMLGLNLENTTSEDFRVTLTGRYLALRRDRIRLGAAHRRHARIGSRVWPSRSTGRLARRRCSSRRTPASAHRTFNVIQDDAVVASYGQTVDAAAASDVGVNLGRVSDLRVGAYVGRLTANVEVGDPGLPEVNGKEIVTEIDWRYDSQDSPVVPSRGTFASPTCSTPSTAPTSRRRCESGRSSAS